MPLCRPQSAHARTHTDTAQRGRFIQIRSALLPFCLRLNRRLSFVCLSATILFLPFLLLSPCPLSLRLKSDRLCFQPMFEHRAINAGQREKSGGVGRGGATQLVIDREYKVWGTGGDSLAGREEPREGERHASECDSCSWLSITFWCVNFHYS